MNGQTIIIILLSLIVAKLYPEWWVWFLSLFVAWGSLKIISHAFKWLYTVEYKREFFEFMESSTKIRWWFSIVLLTIGLASAAILDSMIADSPITPAIIIITIVALAVYNMFARKIHIYFANKE